MRRPLTCTLTETMGSITLSMKSAAFIHTLQQLTEDGNGVLWVVGNPMPMLQLSNASTSSNRDTSPRNLRRHQRHNLDLLVSEGQVYSHPYSHILVMPQPQIIHRDLLLHESSNSSFFFSHLLLLFFSCFSLFFLLFLPPFCHLKKKTHGLTK